MSNSKENFNKISILIIGSGIIGKFNALELVGKGFKITLLDNAEHKNASNAALGLLMGEIYQKNSGRSWELRKKSIEMWPKWIELLNKTNPNLKIEKPFIQLTTDQKKFDKLYQFAYNNPVKKLEIINENSSKLTAIHEIFETRNFKGLISHEDGRINPKLLLDTIDTFLKKTKINTIKSKVIKIEKNRRKWFVTLNSGEKLSSHIVILCNSLNSSKLLIQAGYEIKLRPVLGQAIEIRHDSNKINFLSLPKNFNIDGKNFIPLTKNQMIIGSTDECSTHPSKSKISDLTEFLEKKPIWLHKKNISRSWFGIRSKPDGEPSPILKTLDKGLIICSGFYKNGILLAPACANWISNEIQKHI
tara:strand:+ start:496 stop:1575 length:1080 start_codon:yes stop_codon:yes gene_type:complete